MLRFFAALALALSPIFAAAQPLYEIQFQKLKADYDRCIALSVVTDNGIRTFFRDETGECDQIYKVFAKGQQLYEAAKAREQALKEQQQQQKK